MIGSRSVFVRNKIVDFTTFIWYRSVMAGLKTFLQWLSTNANEYSIDSLYERQRVLVRVGLLPVRKGRGPGSGVPLTADTLATFLIGLLATDNLREIPTRTSQLCSATPFPFIEKLASSRKKVPTFHAAVAKVLAAPPDSNGLHSCVGIQVSKNPWTGTILTYGKGARTTYHVSKNKRSIPNFISTTSSLEFDNFWTLCAAFKQLASWTD